ncbi:MAG: hypothetical protein JXB32_00025 [Deltaproteobacteria bacterium]|nr:hypothetical protein [Deltaproteobacteria bacterium]
MTAPRLLAPLPALAALLALSSPTAARADAAHDNLRAHFERLARKAELRRARPVRPPLFALPTGDWDLLSAGIDARIHPDEGRLESVATLRLCSQATHPLSRLTFYSGLDVTAVDGAASFSYDPSSWDLTVYLLAPLAPGAELSLTFHTAGWPWCEGWCGIDSDLVYLSTTELMPIDPDALYGIYDDQFLVSCRVALPAGFVTLASGVAGPEEALPDDWTARTFVQSWPGLYFGVSAGRFVVVEEDVGGRPVRVAALPGHDVYNDVLLDIARETLRLDEAAFGPMLYDHLDVAEIAYSDTALAYGLESLVWYVEPHRAGDPTTTYGQLTLSHEIGHQWFGNMLPIGQADAPWLAEGFAEFNAMYYVERATGGPRTYSPEEAAAFRALHGDLYVYLPLFSLEDPPLSSPEIATADPSAYGIVTYHKGAQVVEALRWVVGEEPFFEALRGYITTHREDPVDTADLQDALETVHGGAGSLDWFFDAWVHGRGYPRYTVEAYTAADPPSVSLALDDPARFGRMPVLVRGEGPGATCREQRVEFGAADRADLLLDCTGRPARVRVDPDHRFPHRVVSHLEGDVDLSGEVDGFDLLEAAWSNGAMLWDYAPSWNQQADLDQDGMIAELDLETVRRAFGSRD